MKKTWLSLTLAALMVGFSACENKDDFKAPVSYASGLGPDAEAKAMEWVKSHQEELLDITFEKMIADEDRGDGKCVVNNPDITREAFVEIGYDGLNVAGFLGIGAYMDSLVVERLISQALADNNKTALLMTGTSSSGKSTALKKVPYLKTKKKEVGFVSDQTFESEASLLNMVNKLHGKGFEYKDIYIVLVYCDAPTAYFSACSRLYRTGRTISKEYFDYMYPIFGGKGSVSGKNRVDFMQDDAVLSLCNQIFLDNSRFALNTVEDENEKVIGYKGYSPNGNINTWVFVTGPQTDAIIGGIATGNGIVSGAPTPGAESGTPFNYTYDDNVIKEIISVWEQGGKAPYEFVEKHQEDGMMANFAWYYDFYDPKFEEGYKNANKKTSPIATNIDWNNYPTDGPKCPFYGVRNPEKAKQSMTTNFEE